MPRLKLTREQREAFFAGQAPSIGGEGKCPVGKGYVYTLSTKLTLEVTGIRTRKGGGWSLAYVVFDRRDPTRLLRSTPPVHMEEWERYQHRAPTEAEIEEAAEESAYTSNREGAIDSAEGPSREHLKLYAMESSQDRMARRVKEQRQGEQRALSDRLRELEEAMRTNPNLQRYLNRIEQSVRQAEARKRRDAA
jgi:hypothetical protein